MHSRHVAASRGQYSATHSSNNCRSHHLSSATHHQLSPAVPGITPQLVSRPRWYPATTTKAAAVLPKKPKLSYVGVGGHAALTPSSVDGLSPDKTQWAEQFEGHLIPPRISKRDSDFADLEFVEVADGIMLTELNDLFEKVGFPRRDPDKLRIALKNTSFLVWVRAAKQSRMARLGQMLGFARATSDGVLSATIWDVAVNPAWQRIGLGRALMERLTGKLVRAGIPTITLYAEPGVVALYERLGFIQDPEGIKGMAFQRKQTGKQFKTPALMR